MTSSPWAVGRSLGGKCFGRLAWAVLSWQWGEDSGFSVQLEGTPLGRSVLWAETVWAAAATNYQRPCFLVSLSPLEPKNKVLKTRPPLLASAIQQVWARAGHPWFFKDPQVLLLCSQTQDPWTSGCDLEWKAPPRGALLPITPSRYSKLTLKMSISSEMTKDLSSLYQFPLPAVTNYSKFSSSKKHTFIILQFKRSEVQKRSYRAHTGVAELCSFQRLKRRMFP